jgi:Cytochrome C oxidase, cbb3-type, subunit III
VAYLVARIRFPADDRRTTRSSSSLTRRNPTALWLVCCAVLVGCGSGRSTNSTRVVVEPTIVGCAVGESACLRQRREEVRAAEKKLKIACPRGEVLLVTAGLTSARCVRNVPNPQPIEVPQGVRKAGGRTLAEYEAGARVLAQSGCLACHRIVAVGNRGPGPDLTRVGAKLPAAGIERAIIDARAPMPSFSGLPKQKLRALVQFLALLR